MSDDGWEDDGWAEEGTTTPAAVMEVTEPGDAPLALTSSPASLLAGPPLASRAGGS